MTASEVYQYNQSIKRRDALHRYELNRDDSHIGSHSLKPYNPIQPTDMPLDKYLASIANKTLVKDILATPQLSKEDIFSFVS